MYSCLMRTKRAHPYCLPKRTMHRTFMSFQQDAADTYTAKHRPVWIHGAGAGVAGQFDVEVRGEERSDNRRRVSRALPCVHVLAFSRFGIRVVQPAMALPGIALRFSKPSGLDYGLHMSCELSFIACGRRLLSYLSSKLRVDAKSTYPKAGVIR